MLIGESGSDSSKREKLLARVSCRPPTTSVQKGRPLNMAGRDADLLGAPAVPPPSSSPRPAGWVYSPPGACLNWARRCGRGARSAPCSWPPRMPMAGAPTDLVVDAPPRTPCACSPLQAGQRTKRPFFVPAGAGPCWYTPWAVWERVQRPQGFFAECAYWK